MSSQPDKGFIGFVKLAPCGQGPPGTRQHHRGKKEKQTMKLKGISFPELRLSHANQEHVSPWFLPLLFFFFFFSCPWPLWCSHAGQGHHSRSDTSLLGSRLGAPGPRIKAPEGLLGRKDMREVSEGSFSPFCYLRAWSDYLSCRRR